MPKTLERHELDALTMKSRYTVIDEFDVLTGWSIAGAGATQALDLVNYRSGGAGYKMTVPASIAGVSTKSTGVINLAGVSISDHIRFWVRINVIARLSVATIQFIDNAGSPVTATYDFTSLIVSEWQRISIPKSAFTNGGTINWSSIATIKLNVTATAVGTCEMTFDMLRMMLSPVGYTNGVWVESPGIADVVDNVLKFFDGELWYYNVPLSKRSLYRLNGNVDVILSVSGATIGGNLKTLTLLEIFSPGFDSIAQLLKYQPYYYQDSQIMNYLRDIQGKHLSQFLASLIDMYDQIHSATASYMLDEHERLSGVGEGGSSFSVVQRRGRIATRYAFAWLKANVDNMQKLVEKFVDEAAVTETPATYSFTVQIISPKGAPPNLTEIQAAIELYKPAHLDYTITFTYTTWNAMDAYNRLWNSADTFTWNTFEVS